MTVGDLMQSRVGAGCLFEKGAAPETQFFLNSLA
jgi:hypothetical protein